MKSIIHILSICLFCTLGLAAGDSSDVSVDPTRECKSADDCVRVDDGCCGCTSGGKATSVNKTYQQHWQAQLKGQCKNILCMAVMSGHWTCIESKVACSNGECTLERQKNDPKVNPIRACKTAADCIRVDDGCCGCRNGGTATAIHKMREKEWKSQLKGQCTGNSRFCPEVMSSHPTCIGKAVNCVAGECALVPYDKTK